MPVLSRVLPRHVQDQVLACCDASGVLVDVDRFVDLLLEHATDVVTERWASRLPDAVLELWRERRHETAAAST